MDQMLSALGDLVVWLEWLRPVVPLAALALIATAWWAGRRQWLVHLWASMLAASCASLLAAQALSAVAPDLSPWPFSSIGPALAAGPLVPFAHALRTTLLRFTAPTPVDDAGAKRLRSVAWATFALVMLVWRTPSACRWRSRSAAASST